MSLHGGVVDLLLPSRTRTPPLLVSPVSLSVCVCGFSSTYLCGEGGSRGDRDPGDSSDFGDSGDSGAVSGRRPATPAGVRFETRCPVAAHESLVFLGSATFPNNQCFVVVVVEVRDENVTT